MLVTSKDAKLDLASRNIAGLNKMVPTDLNAYVVLNSTNIKPERKVKYLRQIGEILESMKKVRNYTSVNDFYLNDIHENNFIIDRTTDSVRVVDMDSCKINGNYTFGSRYLSPMSFISTTRKYQHEKNGICGGFFVPTYDTEIYCYIIMILNTLFGENITKMSIPEFYNYLEYLNDI